MAFLKSVLKIPRWALATLALIMLLDQFRRSMYRETASWGCRPILPHPRPARSQRLQARIRWPIIAKMKDAEKPKNVDGGAAN